MKKILCLFLLSAMILLMGCGSKIVHCDICNAEIKVPKDSVMNDDWTLYCQKCNQEYGIEEAVIEAINE